MIPIGFWLRAKFALAFALITLFVAMLAAWVISEQTSQRVRAEIVASMLQTAVGLNARMSKDLALHPQEVQRLAQLDAQQPVNHPYGVRKRLQALFSEFPSFGWVGGSELNPEVYVVNEDWNVLIGPAKTYGHTIGVARSILQSNPGWAIVPWDDGKEYIVAFARSSVGEVYPGLNWTILARRPLNDVAEAANLALVASFQCAVLFALLFAVIGWGIGSAFAERLSQRMPFLKLEWLLYRRRHHINAHELLADDGSLKPITKTAAQPPDGVNRRRTEALSLAGLIDELVQKALQLGADVPLGNRDEDLTDSLGMNQQDQSANKSINHIDYRHPLTGLGSFSWLNLIVTRLDHDGPSDNEEIIVIALDLDDFKLVNEAYSHEVGDYVLQVMASRIRASLRAHDIAIHLQADKFLLLVAAPKGESRHDAIRVLERVAVAVSQPIQYDTDTLISLSSSAGAAIWPDHGAKFSSIINYAEGALQSSKRLGRNGFVVHGAADKPSYS